MSSDSEVDDVTHLYVTPHTPSRPVRVVQWSNMVIPSQLVEYWDLAAFNRIRALGEEGLGVKEIRCLKYILKSASTW